MGRSFVEKIFNAQAGNIVFKQPDIVLTHDNTASIEKTFSKMSGNQIFNTKQLLIVLDHNAPPTNAKLANQYQSIRNFSKAQNISKFHDAGHGICHQIMADYARPGMLIVGSDSHTCTAGAFNTMAAGIDRTETAGIWKRGETWFRVPETIKITLIGKLRSGVYAKDISLWIIGLLGSDGANYMSIEYHGDGVNSLSISDRMTITNLSSEMGAKNAVFPPDKILAEYFNQNNLKGIWADEGANYYKEIQINLDDIIPLVAAPHHVDNIKAVSEVEGIKIHQALIGTCTNGRLIDIKIASEILKDKTISKDVQLLIAPASKKIYLHAIEKGYISTLIKAGAHILGPSCGPCLGSGQGIPADDTTVLSTANRNFKGRMGNSNAEIYLASPACVALSALNGKITNPCKNSQNSKFPYAKAQSHTSTIKNNENRKQNGVWDYSDIDNLNTDQMFAGNLTYDILSSNADAILPHLFKGFDENFSNNAYAGDIIIAGENFGCGSSREHPAVGLAHIGIKAIVVKSANRIFYRSCINQGLLLLVMPDVVDSYKSGNKIQIDFYKQELLLEKTKFKISELPTKLMDIILKKGLVNSILSQQ